MQRRIFLRACAAADVEEITHKTGHYQNFNDFLRMLRMALSADGGGDATLDILTYADLQALKSRRKSQGRAGDAGEQAATSSNNKRYIILTHTGRERSVSTVHTAHSARPIVSSSMPVCPSALPQGALPSAARA